jgi:hypothetical protein
MSGLLVTEELRGLESAFGLSLGHGTQQEVDDESSYYPQFEQSVRAEAEEMSKHYQVFYCLETAIRKLISDTLADADGTNWWGGARVPEKIKTDVDQRLLREVDSGMTRRSEKLIDYTNFGELSVVITNNWDLFGAIFSSRRAVERVMNNLNLLRGPIAHCCPITEDEVDRLRLTVKDWFRMMA